MSPEEPIVVVGSSCRFPGGVDRPSKLWELLREPKDLRTEVPKDRFNIDAFYHRDGAHHGRTNARHGYFLKDSPRAFDASFFNIQAGEAESMDPQQRLLLETTYDAVSAAGYGLHDLRGSDTAVYVGLMTHDFELVKVNDMNHCPTYFATGAATSIASNRLSYFFDWHGPSMTVDTACSSSLVAVHLAAQQLRSGTSKTAVAAGSNLILSPMNYITESKLNMLSPTGRSRMWDSAADGYARGEGVCTVVLKTLSQALRDGDAIECVIRETGVNQDGRTTGITMPSHAAQETLIRDTYARAGLDITRPEGRCQFFEAHGTGTPAGDPQEAEAIARAFFGGNADAAPADEKLFVGSLKTVIGHTEGTAGIAGLLKASLAVQHGVVPPNLLFEKLSPKVAPFYDHLRIVSEAQPWPEVAPGQPRRVSVNSFGFGGTNAHAIVEEYKPGSDITTTTSEPTRASESAAYALPLVLSAKSDRSLKKLLQTTAEFVKSHPDVDMLDLLWTLLSKRSVLPYRHAVVGSSRETLTMALEAAVAEKTESSPLRSSSSSATNQEKARLLGVFTGQGAQWPGMLKELIVAIPAVRDIVAELDNSLQTLPSEYRPSWSLLEQFMLEGDDSNVGRASFSQPMCCAAQIVLTRLLATAGVEFTTVVGHSSGEIACAHAAGFIGASQAIRIAYLRGLVSRHAASPNGGGGGEGAMLAAGASLEDAQELCELELFEGRVCVAASNSPDSTTLSGDADAIAELRAVLEDESKFARVLKVDKAYHSHHMLPCSAPYLKALADCGCDGADGEGASSVAWYSSVRQNKRMEAADVTAQYWTDNLVSPVRFMQAVEAAAIEHDPLDAAVEVGCHPALQAPCLATLKTVVDREIPYTGCMRRGANDVQAFAAAVGRLWASLDVGAVDPDRLVAEVVSPEKSPRSLAGELPQYPWDHVRHHWTETRAINAHLHGARPHLLLGSLSPSSTASTSQWHNTIRPRDHDWLQGHALQGQAVFPAAGYIVMAMEAALHAAGGSRAVQLLEVVDMSIDKAVTFEDENSPAELIVTTRVIDGGDAASADQLTVGFSIDSCLAKESKPSTSARGQVVVTFGEPSPGEHLLPPPADAADPPHATNINMKNFYLELDELGFDYGKDYRCVYSLARADGKAAGTMAYPVLADGPDPVVVVHPASIDLAFQTIMGAYSAPGDKRLRSIYVPVHVGRVSLVPAACASALDPASSEHAVRFHTVNSYDGGDVLAGDVTVVSARGHHPVLYRVENLLLKPLAKPSAAEDHRAFTKTVWGPLEPEKLLDDPELWATEQDKAVIPVIERVCYFFMREFIGQLTNEDRANATGPHQRYIFWNEHVSAKVREGTWHEWYDASWEEDTREDIEELCADHWYHPHIKMAKRVSENSLATIRDNINPFLWMDNDGLLEEFYQSYLTSGPGWLYGQDLVGNICHRYQNMDILEIGGGTGSATKYILDIPQLGFNSYTFTDISPAFFEKARQHFAAHEDRMAYRKLDITRSPREQGFEPHSYDMVVASSVLHATPRLAETMAHVRSLLRPGGHVVLLEATHRDHTRVGFLFGLFPDWWAGADEGRDLDPFADIARWDAVFKQTGFSGVDARTLDRHGNLFPNTLFCTHAVNAKMARLDDPLAAAAAAAAVREDRPLVVVVGGTTAKSARILARVRELLPGREVLQVDRLEDVLGAGIAPKSTFLVLSELDHETFSDLDEARFESIKTLHDLAGHLLWLTEAAMTQNPHQAMSIAFLRSTRLEYPAAHIQSVDVDDARRADVGFLVEQLLRLEEASGVKDDVLWTLEPEVYVSGSRAYIPRIKHDVERNNRILSKRRAIEAPVDVRQSPVAVKLAGQGLLYLESCESRPPVGVATRPGRLRVEVDYSLANAVRVGEFGYWHLLQGAVEGTSRQVVVLSETNASIVDAPSELVVDAGSVAGQAKVEVLLQVAARLLADRILSGNAPGASVLLFEPPGFCVDTIVAAAEARNVRVFFATGQSTPPSTAVSWIRLHPKETDAGIKRCLPPSLSAFYNLSETYKAGASLSSRVASHLPPGCLQFDLAHLVQPSAAPISLGSGLSALTELVTTAVTSRLPSTTKDGVVTAASDISTLRCPTAASSVIDWTADDRLQARVRAVDAGALFVKDKTYLLLGLSGSLGRSLARWLVTRGARHVVLSSRNPETPDPRWLAEIEGLGGSITVLAIDVSREASIEAGLARIRQTLPPVAGIAYGPLVLHDALLSNMDLATMSVPVNSKVVGAKMLHDRFSDRADAPPLDFFVMFSSVATVGGNPGQANYTAANAFLQALAQKRRAMGLPASTIHIGAVIGAGYLARTQREEEFKLASDTDTISEDEFLTLFGEAVVSGRKTAGGAAGAAAAPLAVTATSDMEIITGIPEFSSRHRETIKFYDDPRFGNLRVPEGRASSDGAAGGKTSVKEQLLRATSVQEVRGIIADGLSQKMRGILHIPADEQVDAAAPLIDQGVDSLGAITVGSWFSKTLMIDMPLLRVVSGASIAELADEAAGRLSRAVIPLVAPEDGAVLTGDDSSSGGSQADTPITPVSVSDLREDDGETAGDGKPVSTNVPLSLTQEHSWKLLQQLSHDPAIFHNTIGVFMKGSVDLDRLQKAVLASLRRHDIFRTAFLADGTQQILPEPASELKCVPVSDRAAAEHAYRLLEAEPYDLPAGETLKLVDYHWGGGGGRRDEEEHLFVVGYHRLVGDGSTTQNLLNEVGQLYDGARLPPPPQQYASFALRQRADVLSGRLDADLAYWTSLFATPPAVLPVLPLPHARPSRAGAGPVRWVQHVGVRRLSAVLAFRVRERCRRLKGVTPMHFYLAAFRLLLSRLAAPGGGGGAGGGADDIAVGVADTNRASIQDVSTMGFFANLLPVRMAPRDPSHTFADELVAVKERVRRAMQHARVPHGVILERLLGLSDDAASAAAAAAAPATELPHAPLFQAVFDYRQGAAETGRLGGASFTEIWASRERTPHDVVLEMSDDPARDPLVTVKLQSYVYGEEDPAAFLDAYEALLTSLSENTKTRCWE
ncbi:Lovastatin nonaketide synthase mokA [Colletotrichum sidae]|uniref:Lovastatin nonaketide synthase mokA n=1 Tax=Colletotrichum sidae TaxID=1347389 RepID=A0A4R8T6C8_9PEZI|nr:Lovastatin nonaketide synthase mokA [Colletotrichum sidae]